MSCEKWEEYISEYLDQTLPRELHLQMEAHLKECPFCRAVEWELRQMRRQCREMEDIPARTVHWKAIRSKLMSAGGIALPNAEQSRESFPSVELFLRQIAFYRRLAFGSIATCLVILGFGIGVFWISPSRTSVDPGFQIKQLEVQLAVMQLQKAISRVAVTLDKSKVEWQPEMWKVVDTNLAALDQAITESQKALLKDPDNEEAGTYLIQACQKKLAVLNSVLNMTGI